MCGIFGVYGSKDAPELTYLGLYALQHRGQESAGMAVFNGSDITCLKGLGLVSDIFSKKKIKSLKGTASIGHVRYSTSGATALKNAQPLSARWRTGAHSKTVALAHNGNIVNTKEVRKHFLKKGMKFKTSVDTELILQGILHSGADNAAGAVVQALAPLKGAYSLAGFINDKLVAVRDPYGVRPLCLGKLKSGTGVAWAVASESVAFDIIGADYVREIQPGEILLIDENGLKSTWLARPISERKPRPSIKGMGNCSKLSNQEGRGKSALCIFEFIYFSRPDSIIFNNSGRSVYSVRKKIGQTLSEESRNAGPPAADIVLSVPDSSNVQALGFHQDSGVPLEAGLVRNHYIGR
ncbi:MAG: class II glutamine amidotransferase, partial [Elusimicrobiota bacterium]